MNEQPIRVLVVDDHPVVREGLAAMLARQPDFSVVGEAGDGPSAVEAALALDPDVVLMDLRLPGFDGVEATRRIRAGRPGVEVIILTTYDRDEMILAALRAGAKGFLLKDAPRDEIFSAIRAVRQGGSSLHPAVAARLVRHVTGPGSASDPDALTARETEVLRLLARGAANKEIAAALHLGESTVKTHLANIFQKLGVRDRTEAVTKAMERGILPVEGPYREPTLP